MEVKKSKGSIIIIVLLGLIILALIAYICYDKGMLGKKNNAVAKDETAEANLSKTKDFDLKEAEKLLAKFGFHEDFRCGQNIYDYYYEEGFKQLMALKQVSDSVKIKKDCSELYTEKINGSSDIYQGKNGVCYKENGTILTPYDDVNKIYKSMYGADMPKEGFSTTHLGGLYYNFYDYNEPLNSFVQLECGGCGGACGPNINISKIESAKENTNNIIIRVRYYGGSLTTTVVGVEGTEYQTITTSHNNIILESKDLDSAKKEIEEKYLDKLDLYEIVFTKQDGNYIFKSLTKKLS